MAKRTPPFSQYPAWSESRFFGFIRSALRSAFRRWAPKYEVVEDAKRDKPKSKPGRHRFEYKCSKCKRYYKRTEVEVDHIEQVGSLKSFEDLPGFAQRMFVGKEKLRLLCKGCHKKVTAEQRRTNT